MREFSGFPDRTRFTPIPDLFFTSLLPEMDDIAEIKVVLHIFWAIYRKKGYPRFVTHNELAADSVLLRALGPGSPQTLQAALEQAVEHGILLHTALERDGEKNDLYFVNTEPDRRAMDRINSGELKLGGLPRPDPAVMREKPNIFALYEKNIGMLSPIIAEELKEAERAYPESWVEDAFKEAVQLNKRNWRYISRILERWAAEGKANGEHRRHSQTGGGPEEFRRRYGHLLQK
ncbi:MAG: DnaD domain protein [Dehalococcoidia bacterium]|nr:DnaD domain protein [Dehalococcoidia bacterium]